jgi:orotate phosphoribosyltransferase
MLRAKAMVNRNSLHADSRRERLRALLVDKSFRRGRFTLSSGEQSDVFFDVKMTSLDPEGAYLAADLILDMLEDERVDAIGGLAMGACPIVSALCVRSYDRGMPIPAFYVRKEEKRHGTQKKIEGLDLKKGDRVVIVDDVATKGGSMLDAIHPVEELGCHVVRAIVVVDREQGAEARLEEAGHRLESVFKRSDLE